VIKGCWCDIIVLNVRAPTEGKNDDMKDSFYGELERALDQFLKYHIKVFLGDFKAKVGREVIFKPTIGKGSLYEHSNDNNGVTVLNFAR
jgi:hypothetical protein